MKTQMLLFLTCMILSSACNGVTYPQNEKTFKVTDKDYSFIQDYKVSTPTNLKISTSGGNITTTGCEGDNIEVTFIVRKRDEVLDITLDQLKEIADVEIIHNNNLEINIKRIYEKKISVSFKIKTPYKSSVNLNTSGGNVSVTDVTGNHKMNTSGGNLDFEKINGIVEANTSGGNITIGNSSADFDASTSGGNISLNNIEGKLNVTTSGGNIYAENIKPLLNANTSGGNIHLKKVQGPVDVSSSGGSINLDEISGSVKAITSGGNISANLIQLTSSLELETSGGDIHATIPDGLGLDLDLSAENINTSLKNFSGTSKKDKVKGQMNGGGILVRLSTSGGSINLDYK